MPEKSKKGKNPRGEKKKPAKAYPYQDDSPTGNQDLDLILGGGFPRGSTILLAGTSGSGKTLMAFRWLFEGVKKGENGIYISMTEPLFKIVRNLEIMEFYDRNAIEEQKLEVLDLRSSKLKKMESDEIISYIEDHVKKNNARRLCLDSVTAIAYSINDKGKIRQFIFELGKVLASLGCTTVLTSEIMEKGKLSAYGVEEFISDGILKLDQTSIGGRLWKSLRIIKLRGRTYNSERTFYKITPKGIIIFPKIVCGLEYPYLEERISIGNTVLDEMMDGGLFAGSSTIVIGASGTGKTIASLAFINEGVQRDDRCLYVGFDESKEVLFRNARSLGCDLEEYESNGSLVMRCLHPSERFIDEHIKEIAAIVETEGIRRCVIDPISAFGKEIPDKLNSEFSTKLNSFLKSKSVTNVFTSESQGLMGTGTIVGDHISQLVDNIIALRHVEMEGQLKRVLSVIKTRGSGHSKELRIYDITEKGMVIGEPLSGYEGLISGIGRKVSKSINEKLEAEFRKFIGPMGKTEFDGISKKGVTEENLVGYVDSLAKEKIMGADSAEEFKKSIRRILRGDAG